MRPPFARRLRPLAPNVPTLPAGLSHPVGWVGYLNRGTLFVKRMTYDPKQNYPDGGVNYETFTTEGMLEMESLGPLVRLAPGQAVEHVETWSLHRGPAEAKSEAELDAVAKIAAGGR